MMSRQERARGSAYHGTVIHSERNTAAGSTRLAALLAGEQLFAERIVLTRGRNQRTA